MPDNTRSVTVIGNFDGVHKGHQALLGTARKIADAAGAKVQLLSFSPHPKAFFNPGHAPFRLTCDRHKIRLARHFGADRVILEPFDAAFAALAPQAFISDILVDKYNSGHVVVGYDFRFGKGRKGDAAFLRQAGAQLGFDVTVIAPQESGGAVFSSSQIRADIENGHLAAAAAQLGWVWEIEGAVIHGDKRGRDIGYPTANMRLGDYVRPPFGIYAVEAFLNEDGLASQNPLYGVANLGIRPMFEVTEPLLEAHIFDFDRDIYGQVLRVRPVAWLRGEECFTSLDDLVKQIGRDADAARHILKERPEHEKT